MNYLFPIAFSMNSFSMTALMVVLGVSGRTELAASVGVIQGAIAALYLSFSANARSIILNPASGITASSIFQSRLILILPLAIMAYLLSTVTHEADVYLIVTLILRRCVEWISEIQLSERELLNDLQYAKKFTGLQAVAFTTAIIWILGNFPMAWLGLLVWALAPMLMSVEYVRDKLHKPLSFHHTLHLMLPQFGSTMVIGITLYIFRIVILFLAGKETAGILFTAFALGGMIGSIFAQVLGPSVVLYEDRQKKSFFSTRIRVFLGLTVIIGSSLFILSQAEYYNLGVSIKAHFFWGSISASLVGGVIMVYAQYLKFRFLQLCGDKNLFGPDLLMNLLMILIVPYLYYEAGRDSLMILYIINAMLAYVFYWSAARQENKTSAYNHGVFIKIITAAIPFILLLPIFFQINGGIFRDSSMTYDSGGILNSLPIPVAVFACYFGVLFIGKYREAYKSLCFVFFSIIAMLMASFIATDNQQNEIMTKLIFLLQYVLPMIAIVLGQLYGSENESLETMYKALFYVIVILIPVQLLSTLLRGTFYLSPYVYVFSIYQHLQYVPLILVSAYLLAMFGLWHSDIMRRIILVFMPLVGVYAVASHSISSMILLVFGVLGLAVYNYLRRERYKVLALNLVIVLLLFACCIFFGNSHNGYVLWGTKDTGYLYFGRSLVPGIANDFDTTWQKYGILKINQLPESQLNHVRLKDNKTKVTDITNISSRTAYWKYYIEKSLSSAKVFMFGSSEKPDRSKITSAHNYYLDLLHSFGFISVLPLLAMVVITVSMMMENILGIIQSAELCCLVLVTMYLLFISNSLGVGLRQPYPGIFTFFIWGILIARLERMKLAQARHAISQ